MLHKGKPRIFDASKSASNSRTSSTFTIGKNPHLTKHKLHSKSTCFYRWGSKANDDSDSSAHNSANRLRCASAHCEQAASCKESARANRTRRSLDKSLYSGMTERKRLAHSFSYLVPSVCSLALLIGGVAAASPMIYSINANTAYATNDSKDVNNSTESPSLSITVNGNPSETTTAKPNEVAYRSNTFTVESSNYQSYKIILSAMNGSGPELHGRNNPYAIIGGVGTNVSPNDFAANTWGYNFTPNNDGTSRDELETLTYSTVPDYDRPRAIFYRTPINHSDVFTGRITFAAKISADSPSDHYISSLVLSVVGTPGEVIENVGFTSNGLTIYGMQEMTNELCEKADAEQNRSAQLIDYRDDKLYYVSKMEDGHCWMTQNLDLDLSANVKLTPANTNVTEEWLPENSTMTGDLKTSSNTSTNVWSSDNLYIQSYDPGDYYYNIGDGANWEACSAANLSSCLKNGNWLASVPADEAHYHVGNYYSWNAATAGTGSDLTQGEAQGSICPKGWKLPSRVGDTSYDGLLSAYNVSSNVTGIIRQSPLFFIPAGFTYTSGLAVTGREGRYWTTTPHSNGIDTYDFEFSSKYASTSITSGNTTTDRHNGYSIRCVNDPNI